MNEETINLWELLKKYEIVIPVIQRDYAQGREGKEFVLDSLVDDIKKIIEKHFYIICSNNPILKLDYIYGVINNGTECFNPLDGQQRLTTLWLVHWYIAVRSERIKDKEVKNRLERFTYRTRESSKDFCKSICENVDQYSENLGIVEYIKKQNWFYSIWIQDPTVKNMLRALERIESSFKKTENFLGFWNLLAYRPIVVFELLNPADFKIKNPDDLYIKMNARGKALTEFEHFKPDWVSKLDSPEVAEKIDNGWNDVFWTHSANFESPKNKLSLPGILFFDFIDSFMLNKISLNDSISADAIEKVSTGKKGISDMKANKEVRSLLHSYYHIEKHDADHEYKGTGIENPDRMLDYLTFMDYKEYLCDSNNSKELGMILDSFANENNDDRIREVEDKVNGVLKGDDFKFVKTEKQTLAHRIYFHAVCKFFSNKKSWDGFKNNATLFEDWIRVVRNITKNAQIDSEAAYVNCLRLINKIGDKSDISKYSIYDVLCDIKTDPVFAEYRSSNTYRDKQLEEEIEKAEKIKAEKNNKLWKDNIQASEDYAFFNGTIRFLYRDPDGSLWDNFTKKRTNAESLFNQGDVVPDETVKNLLNQYRDFDEIKGKYLFTKVGDADVRESKIHQWKREILCSEDIADIYAVDRLLTGKKLSEKDQTYECFLNSPVIDKVLKDSDSHKYVYEEYGDICRLFKRNSQYHGIYFHKGRKEKCEKLKELSEAGTVSVDDFNEYCLIGTDGYYWGIKVAFQYNDKRIEWVVDLNEDNGQKKANDKIILDKKKEEIWDKPDDLHAVLDKTMHN